LLYELAPPPEPEEAFLRMAGVPHCLFLDSTLRQPVLGRYSFLAADPFDFVEAPADGSDQLAVLAGRLRPLAGAIAFLAPELRQKVAAMIGERRGVPEEALSHAVMTRLLLG
jgi:hypothetical protein